MQVRRVSLACSHIDNSLIALQNTLLDQVKIIVHPAMDRSPQLLDLTKLSPFKAIRWVPVTHHLKPSRINKPLSLRHGRNATSSRPRPVPLHLQAERVPLRLKLALPFQRRAKKRRLKLPRRGRHTMLLRPSMRSRWRRKDGVRLRSSRRKRRLPDRVLAVSRLIHRLIKGRVKPIQRSALRIPHRFGRALVPRHLKGMTILASKHRMATRRRVLCRCPSLKFTVNRLTTPTSHRQVS